jgi:predicted nucleic acid-binding protein
MKLFLDANVLVSVLNKEYPVFPYSARILSLTEQKGFALSTSAICLAIAWYFAEKKNGRSVAKNKINLLLEHIEIADCGKKEAALAVKNKKVNDLEDGLEYYSALNAKCNCIITSDINDFYFSNIEVLEPEKFLKKYMR